MTVRKALHQRACRCTTLFLRRDHSRFVTGQTLHSSGGLGYTLVRACRGVRELEDGGIMVSAGVDDMICSGAQACASKLRYVFGMDADGYRVVLDVTAARRAPCAPPRCVPIGTDGGQARTLRS